MTTASSLQANFNAGEWAPSKQGRYDDPRYKMALAKCLNYIPTTEGSLRPRGGFRRIGTTFGGVQAKLLPFRFSTGEAYVAEVTDFHVRLWANGLLVLQDTVNIASVSTGGTPTFTTATPFPTSWTLLPVICAKVHFSTASALEKAPFLAGRDVIVNITGASTCTLSDAFTGASITTPVSATFTARLDLVYMDVTPNPLTNVDPLRILEFTTQQILNNGETASAPEHKASILTQQFPPWSFSASRGVTDSLRYEQFIDGPYFDSAGGVNKMTVSATTGDITVMTYVWDATVNYGLGQIAATAGVGYTSLIKANLNNALPSTVDAHWAIMPALYNSGTTYAANAYVFSNPTAFGIPTVYYSLAGSNVGNTPASSPTKWSKVPPAFAAGTTYGVGAVVRSNTINYISIQAANTGHTPSSSPTWWLPVDFQAALANTMFSGGDAADTAPSGSVPAFGQAGRCFRIKAAPQPWSNLHTYAQNDLVNFGDEIFKSLVNSNLNNQPDVTPADWEAQATTIQWTWGYIKTWNGPYSAVISLQGPDLPNTNACWEWQFGVFSDTTGWPSCATYHEGRVVLSGAVPNRIDMGQPDQGFSFAPTAPDGTVSDGNGIAMVLNATGNEHTNALQSTVDGIAVFTDYGEWVIAASNLNDPLTPTSVQAKRGTTFTSGPVDAATLTSSHAFVMGNRRRLLEYKQFVDITAYQVRPNAADLTRDCQHLTLSGIGEVHFQRIPQPVIWCSAGQIEPACSFNLFSHSLFGIGYTRDPDQQYVAPFSTMHGVEYVTGDTRNTRFIAVQYGSSDTRQYLYTMGFDNDRNANIGHMEMLEPVLDTAGFDNSVSFLRQAGQTDTESLLGTSCFLDAAITPVGYKQAGTFDSVTFYGMWQHVGKTLSFVIMGKYIGDYLVASDGSVSVPFTNGASTKSGRDGNFSAWDLGAACAQIQVDDVTTLPQGYQEFLADDNGNPFGTGVTSNVTFFCAYFGYKYPRQGQLMKPLLGSQDGATPFGKTIRVTRAAFHLDTAVDLKVGTDFTNLQPFPMTISGAADTTPTGINNGMIQTTTGVFRDFALDDYSYSGQVAWKTDLPYPGGILSVGSFYEVNDV